MAEELAHCFCAKRKPDGTWLVGLEPFVPLGRIYSFLDGIDPNWSFTLTELKELSDGKILAAGKLVAKGVERSALVTVEGGDPHAALLLALAQTWGFEAPVRREKIWLVLPDAEWRRIKDRLPLTWVEAKELAMSYRDIPRPTYASRAHEELKSQLERLGWSEPKLILWALDRRLLERAVPGLEFLTEEQASRILDALREEKELTLL